MLKFYYQNVSGIRTKFKTVYRNVRNNDYDVIAFTESHLIPSIKDDQFIDHRYRVYRRDCFASEFGSKSNGGGCLLAVKKNIKSIRMIEMESPCDDLWIALDIQREEKIKRIGVCVFYSLCRSRKNKYLELETFLRNTTKVMRKFEKVIILGDFNLSNITWIKFDPKAKYYFAECKKGIKYWTILTSLMPGLRQYNNILNSKQRILDLVFTNLKCELSKAKREISKVSKHHPPLEILFKDIFQENRYCFCI